MRTPMQQLVLPATHCPCSCSLYVARRRAGPHVRLYASNLADARAATVEHISELYPDLIDIAKSGALLYWNRPADYVERRSDGYQEPLEVYILGTNHFSQASAEQVTRLVEAVKPENVVVEICRSRVALLNGPSQSLPSPDGQQSKPPPGRQQQKANPMGLSGDGAVQSIMRSVRLGGSQQLLVRGLLAFQADRVAQQMGSDSQGAETRAASAAAAACGATIVLGDRPIEVTLQRAWHALSWAQRLNLAWSLVTSRPQASDLELLKESASEEAMADVLQSLSTQYPQLVKPLVDERDQYLAWSLKRSKAVNGTKRVVGVLGLGHLQGVHQKMTTDSGSLRFRDLVRPTHEMLARQEASERRWQVFNSASVVISLAWLAYVNRTALQQLLPDRFP